MNALKIKVSLPHITAKVLHTVSQQGRYLRCIIGKHGELRINEVETLDDVDIETKKNLERVYVRTIYAPDR